MRRSYLAAGAAAGVIATYAFLSGRLPPRTPIGVARVATGLPVPRSAEVIEFLHRWVVPPGDGECFIVIRLDGHDLRRLADEAARHGYLPLASVVPSERVAAALSPSASGLAHSEGSPSDGTTIVLDTVNARLIVHLYAS